MWMDKSGLSPEERKQGEKLQRDFNDAAYGNSSPGEDSRGRGKSTDKPEAALNVEPTVAEKREGAALDQQSDPGRLERMQAAARRRQEREQGMSLGR